jgi:LTXXQ motif family protein
MFRRNPWASLTLVLALVATSAIAQKAEPEQPPAANAATGAAAAPAIPAPQQGAMGMVPGSGGMPVKVINNTFNPTGPTGTGTFNPTARFVVNVNEDCGGRGDMIGMMSPATARHVEGRIAFLKAELRITDAQLPLWNAVAGAMRDDAKSMSNMSDDMKGTMSHTGALPERLAAREKAMAARLDAVRTLKAAVGPLYAALSDEQRKVADELTIDMGAMGEGHGKTR